MSLPAEKIQQIEPPALAPMTPMDMLARAVQSGADLDMIEKLMNLQERWEASNARKAFDEAVAAAKAEIPVIVKNASSHNNKYADFAAIARAVDPVLSRHGIRYRFRTQQTDKSISVTCVLTHKDGHAEENTLTGPVDATVGKNPIQAIGSTLTYLQRYSLVQALGLAASSDDDAAAAAPGGVISLEQVEQLLALADEVEADKEAFCRYFKVEGIAQLKAKDFDRAIAALNKKRKA
jgi:hypothetical protein